MEGTLEFDLSDFDQAKAFANITAEWTKHCVNFKVTQDGSNVTVRLNGGF